MNPLMKRGATQIITEADLFPLKPSDESSKLGDDLKSAMEKQSISPLVSVRSVDLLTSRSSLWKALFVAYGGPYAVAAGLKVVHDLLAFLQPQLLRLFLSYVSAYQETRYNETERPSKFEGILIPITMFIASVLQTIIINQVSGSALTILVDFLINDHSISCEPSRLACASELDSSLPSIRKLSFFLMTGGVALRVTSSI